MTEPLLDTVRFIEQLARHGELLAHTAESTGLATPVPTCPGWTVAAAVGHTAKVHAWVTWILRGGDPETFSYHRPEQAELIVQYRAGVTELVNTLRRVPEGLAVHTLWPQRSARQFWARRQAHETAIHAVDVQLAADYGVAEIDVDFAADGVDELVMNMAAEQFSPGTAGGARRISITPLDANQAWTLRVTPTGVSAHRGAEDGADLSVFGLTVDLYRWVWNRAGDYEVSLRGDLSLADRWHTDFRVGVRGG